MARLLHVQYPGALCHVTCRDNERKDICQEDADRKRFLQILSQSLPIYTLKLHSYSLMTNHFPLLLETPRGNLAEFMRHFHIANTGHFNGCRRRSGPPYQGRYRSLLGKGVSPDPTADTQAFKGEGIRREGGAANQRRPHFPLTLLRLLV
jgi:putative transposase